LSYHHQNALFGDEVHEVSALFVTIFDTSSFNLSAPTNSLPATPAGSFGLLTTPLVSPGLIRCLRKIQASHSATSMIDKSISTVSTGASNGEIATHRDQTRHNFTHNHRAPIDTPSQTMSNIGACRYHGRAQI
jgi:hypothetical protein